MYKKIFNSILALALCANIMSACSAGNEDSSELSKTGALIAGLSQNQNAYGQGSLTVLSSGINATALTRVEIIISGTGINKPLTQDLTLNNQNWEGIIGKIPAGTDRNFTANAYDAADQLVYQGTAGSVNILAGDTTAVYLTLQPLTPPAAYANSAPVLDAVFATPLSTGPGGAITLDATAHDPDAGDNISYVWTADSGTLSDSGNSRTDWTAPATEGSYNLNLTVSDDSNLKTSFAFSINVSNSAGKGSAGVTATVNDPPFATHMDVTDARLDRNDSTTASVLATDLNGDSITYAWSANCAGTFDDATTSTTVFTADPAAVYGACALTVNMDDGRGGVNSGSISILIAEPISLEPAPVSNYSPQVLSSFQSTATIQPNGIVIFRVTANDPEATVLSFEWTVDQGLLSGPQTRADAENTVAEVYWTAPACGPASNISLTITDADNIVTLHEFTPVILTENTSCTQAGVARTRVTASDYFNYDHFGTSVDIQGNTAVIGSPDEDTSAAGAGAVYVQTRAPDGTWTEVNILQPNDPLMFDAFGSDVSLSGNFLLVGAPGKDSVDGNAYNSAGAAYMFTRAQDGTWSQEARLTPSDPTAEIKFGNQVAVSGNFAVVGVNGIGTNFEGRVYLFERNGNGEWIQTQIITPPTGSLDSRYGQEVALSGTTLVVGAPIHNSFKGAAYIYERDQSGVWNLAANLENIAPSGSYFGDAVAVSGDRVVIGAPRNNTGSVYVFERDNAGSWNQTANVFANDPSATDFFGQSVDLDGGRIVVGAPYRNLGSTDNPGALYMINRQSNGSWLVYNNQLEPYSAHEANLGLSIAISGSFIIGGAPNETIFDGAHHTEAGTAYIFKQD